MDVEIVITSSIGDAEYRLTGVMGELGPVLRKVEISGDDLQSEHLRIPIISTFREGFAASPFGITEEGPVPYRVGRGRKPDAQAMANRLYEIAEVARSAESGRKGVTVATTFGVSAGYARHLISAARKAGYLTSTS